MLYHLLYVYDANRSIGSQKRVSNYENLLRIGYP